MSASPRHRRGSRKSPGLDATGLGPSRWRPLVGLAASLALVTAGIVTWSVWRVPDRADLVAVAPIRDAAAPSLAKGSGRLTPAGRGELGSLRHVTIRNPRGAPHIVAREAKPSRTFAAPVVGAVPSPPVRMTIPALHVSATVVPEPVDASGSLRIPPPSEVGWYEAGPAPGQAGSTLLAGHIDFGGAAGALYGLRALPVGALVSLVGANGGEMRYEVAGRFQVPKTALSSIGVLRNEGPSTLVVVTCGGAFEASSGHYADNVIVVATPIRT